MPPLPQTFVMSGKIFSAYFDSQIGLTRSELARALGVTRQYVDRLCRGKCRPALEMRVAITRLTSGKVDGLSLWVSDEEKTVAVHVVGVTGQKKTGTR